MGIFKRRITAAYADETTARLAAPQSTTLAITTPWSPQDTLTTWAANEALGGLLDQYTALTRETALRIPGVKRSHGIVVGSFAGVPLFQMDGDVRTEEQPEWLTNSASGVAPYHRMFGLGSDMFFHGWGLLAFTDDLSDCLHVPFGLWKVLEDGSIEIDGGRTDKVAAQYHAHPVAIPVGFGENGLLTDGADTLAQARKIEAAYQDRLDNPIPLTVLTIAADRWDSWTPEERIDFREKWVEGRKSAKGATAMKPEWVSVDMPGQVQVDLYETGRNGVRIDIANHVGLPVSMLEGVRQGGGGGGTEMRYSGVQNGAQRNEVWDYGFPKLMLRAVEARLSLDDICAPGLSIRGDLSSMLAVPAPHTNPTSED